MEDQDFRYKLEHAGDILVEKLENIARSFSGSITRTITSPMRGIVITHGIHCAEREKQGLVYRIGERVVEIRKQDTTLFADDPAMGGLFSELDTLDGKLDDMIKEREDRLNRIRGRISSVADELDQDIADLAAAPA